jgi:hypothetical protein
MVLAPGREDWLLVTTYVKDSPTSMVPVRSRLTVASSDARVADATIDSTGWVRVTARSAGTATLTIRSLRTGGTSATFDVSVRTAPVGDDAGLRYAADNRVQPSGTLHQPSILLGPSDLQVRVIVSNPTGGTRDLWLSGCSASIRLFRTAALAGSPVVEGRRGRECQMPDRHLVLAPGAADTLQAEGYWVGDFRTDLPEGRYHVAAVVDRVRDELIVPGGTVDVVSPNAGLVFASATSVSGSKLIVRSSIANTNASPVRLEFGACAVRLFAYRAASRTGKPVWDSNYRRPYGTPTSFYGCPEYLATAIIAPAQTFAPREINPEFPVMEMLGDSLAAGRYYFSAAITMNWRETVMPAGEATLTRQ